MIANFVGRMSMQRNAANHRHEAVPQHYQSKLPELSDERSQCVARLYTRHYSVEIVPQVADIKVDDKFAAITCLDAGKK